MSFNSKYKDLLEFLRDKNLGGSIVPIFSNVTINDALGQNPSQGQVGFHPGRSTIEWYDGSNVEHPVFVEDVMTSPTTVSNTTTETEVARKDVDSGSLVEGRVYVLRAFGTYSTGGASDDFTYRVKFGNKGFDARTGGTTITEVSTVQENVTDGPWQARSTFTVRSEGSSGKLASHTEARFNNSPNDDHVSEKKIDTESGEEFVVTVEWNAAKSGNTMTLGQSYLQQMG